MCNLIWKDQHKCECAYHYFNNIEINAICEHNNFSYTSANANDRSMFEFNYYVKYFKLADSHRFLSLVSPPEVVPAQSQESVFLENA